MDVRALLWVGIGSFMGGSLRYVSAWLIDHRMRSEFPWSTLFVNVVGSFLIGFLLPMYSKFGWSRDDALPLMISVGMMGGFTTFSTFSLQTLRLMQSGHLALAGLNAVGSVLSCLLSVYLGWRLGEVIWS
ncbi:fluoride efflux transporter CrcB [Pelagicoccus sp. SDUM812003]|uniref:fluoride efflux transporter CrcB n=1 Tax=Pelagicoccus sp. SDUM812003 TaxID=3041267 RepID=UPI00280FA709|nr:fluoride efflux transporter CrcB [Pelagicoccus sp. SDUM812003]